MTKEKKVHVIADETLGGVKREYVEVDMEAKFGDYVIVFEHSHKDCNGIRRVLSVLDSGYIYFHVDYLGECGAPPENYRVLEPTDIVIIGGKRYRIEERLAETDELILNKSNGLTYDVKDVAGDFIIVGDSQLMLEEDYVVLKRIDAPQSQDDIIANLVRRVADLERNLDESNARIDGTKNDIETWAQEVEKVKVTADTAESNLDDLARRQRNQLCRLQELERSNPKQITLDIDTLAKLIGGVRG